MWKRGNHLRTPPEGYQLRAALADAVRVGGHEYQSYVDGTIRGSRITLRRFDDRESRRWAPWIRPTLVGNISPGRNGSVVTYRIKLRPFWIMPAIFMCMGVTALAAGLYSLGRTNTNGPGYAIYTGAMFTVMGTALMLSLAAGTKKESAPLEGWLADRCNRQQETSPTVAPEQAWYPDLQGGWRLVFGGAGSDLPGTRTVGNSFIRLVANAWRFSLLALLLVAGMASAVPQGRTAAAVPNPTAEQVDGVPLVPAPKEQLAKCGQLARQLRRGVPCPGLVPDPIATTSASALGFCATSRGTCGPAQVWVYARSLTMSQMNFQVPSGYVGVSLDTNNGMVPETASNGGPLGHFVFETGTALVGEYKPDSDRAAASLPSYCLPISEKPVLRIHGSTATYFQCADSSSDRNAIEIVAGHDLLQWRQAGLLVQVSFHGHSQVNLDLDLAVARSVRLIRPNR
jgi:hypothetical protein